MVVVRAGGGGRGVRRERGVGERGSRGGGSGGGRGDYAGADGGNHGGYHGGVDGAVEGDGELYVAVRADVDSHVGRGRGRGGHCGEMVGCGSVEGGRKGM